MWVQPKNNFFIFSISFTLEIPHCGLDMQHFQCISLFWAHGWNARGKTLDFGSLNIFLQPYKKVFSIQPLWGFLQRISLKMNASRTNQLKFLVVDIYIPPFRNSSIRLHRYNSSITDWGYTRFWRGAFWRLTWSLVKGERFTVQAPLALGNLSLLLKAKSASEGVPPEPSVAPIS